MVLGRLDDRLVLLKSALGEQLGELGLDPSALNIVPESEAHTLDPWLPTIGIFLGYVGARDADHPHAKLLLEQSSMIVTAVSSVAAVGLEIPESLRHINAIEMDGAGDNLDRVVSLILEGFRLLRRERRLFISYKRSDSRVVANQLYDALDAKGFDVFIDTRTVPPAVDFQAELWHRLSDSDVVILIDTEGFRSSRWTTEELARANATNIQILHLLWPGQAEDPESALSYFHSLAPKDFSQLAEGDSSALTGQAVEEISAHAERLRARAIAARYRYLVDGFCDAARDRGLTADVQPERWISVGLSDGAELAAVPTIGVPTSDRIHAVFDAIAAAKSGSGGIWVLYDGRGMLGTWMTHLGWLDQYLPVKSVSMIRADSALEGLV